MIDFDASEIKHLGNDLQQIALTSGVAARAVVKKTARDITGTAKTLAPVDTGNLRASIGHSDLRLSARGVIEAEIGPTADYGIWLEIGTSRMAPQPYMGPAAERHEPAFVAAMTQLIDGAL